MYIYNIKVLVKWNFHSTALEAQQECEPEEYNVAARNFVQAMAKAEKLALAKTRGWSDTDKEGKVSKFYPEYVVDVLSSERKEEIDG